MHIVCVEKEKTAAAQFRKTASNFSDVDSIRLFYDGNSALEWAEEHQIDAAFLEMDLPDCHGLVLAKQLQDINKDVRIIFITDDGQYALEAFGVSAIGYVLKPYGKEEIRKELDKAARYRPARQRKIVIQTIPVFSVFVDDAPICAKHRKAMELLALLVDRRGAGLTAGEAVACLWPDRMVSDALFRVTWKRLVEILTQAGIEWLLVSKGKQRYIQADRVECDLYKILDGNQDAEGLYAGEYLREYEWAEMRNAQLSQMLDVY